MKFNFKEFWNRWRGKKEWVVTKNDWDMAEGKDKTVHAVIETDKEGKIDSIDVLPEHLNEMWETALAYGYERYEHQPMSSMISFFKEGVRINVYYTTMTVATALKHPTQGKTQLYRRNVTPNELEQIFRYPRVHTHKGYKKTRKLKLK